MIKVSDLISKVQPSATLALATRAGELRAQGVDVIAFTVGEPDFDTPERVKEAAIAAMRKGYTKYTPVAGILPLREAICSKLKRDQAFECDSSEVIVTNGGKHAIAAALAVLLNPGDEVVIPAPYWTSYPDMVRLVGGEPVIVNATAENGYLMQPDELLRACSANTKVIILNSPSNPTGAAYSANQFRALADAIKSLSNHEDIVVMSDEVYEYLTFDDFKHVSFAECAPELKSNTLIVNALSKSYSMTGWRVGYAAGPKVVIDAMRKHQSQFTSNVCSIAQHAAIEALEMGTQFTRDTMCDAFSRRLDIVCEAFEEIDGVELSERPKGAFYVFPRIEGLLGKRSSGITINSASDFSSYLLDKFAVIVVPGEAFGDPMAFRLSFAVDEATLKKGLGRIAEAVSLLN